eukprot:gene14829-16369_t
MDNDKNNSNNVFHGNFRFVAGRPDLGLSTQSQRFTPLRDQEENLSNLNNEQEEPVVTGMPFSILSPVDGLPAYSMFRTLPKLGRRKRPKIRKRIAQGEGGGSRSELAIEANAEQLIGINLKWPVRVWTWILINDIEDSQDGGDSLECVDNAIMIPQHQRYCIVSRSPMKFADCSDWVYFCTCGNGRMEFVEGLNKEIHQNVQGG